MLRKRENGKRQRLEPVPRAEECHYLAATECKREEVNVDMVLEGGDEEPNHYLAPRPHLPDQHLIHGPLREENVVLTAQGKKPLKTEPPTRKRGIIVTYSDSDN